MIIGLTGKMGVGKSTAIDIIKNLHPDKDFLCVKFAEPLYEIQEYIYEKIAPAYTRPKDFVKDRKLLQWLGSDWARETISPNLWVDLWTKRVLAFRAWDFVCDDVRFDNEAKAIKDLGGSIIRILSRESESRITTNNGLINHSSEKGIDPSLVDVLVWNDGSKEDFAENLKKAFERIREKR